MEKKSISAYAVALCILSQPINVQANDKNASDPKWSYKGETGPQNWGYLSQNFSLCKTGKSQSPINLTSTTISQDTTLTLHYQESPLATKRVLEKVKNLINPGNYVLLNEQRYDLFQIHTHAPSEHTINGKIFPSTIHFVHKNKTGELLVVGILIEEGQENAEIGKMISYMDGSNSIPKGTQLSVNNLVPNSPNFYHYMGSLTTPPCSENVKWFVIKTPLHASAEQIKALKSDRTHTNRPIQPLNQRQIFNLEPSHKKTVKGN